MHGSHAGLLEMFGCFKWPGYIRASSECCHLAHHSFSGEGIGRRQSQIMHAYNYVNVSLCAFAGAPEPEGYSVSTSSERHISNGGT